MFPLKAPLAWIGMSSGHSTDRGRFHRTPKKLRAVFALLAPIALMVGACGGESYAVGLASTFDAAFEDDGVVVGAAVVSIEGISTSVTHESASTSDRFEIASITKPITATLAAVLVGEGTLDLADEIGQWIDAGPNSGITVEQLATHTSGLPRLAPNALPEGVDRANPYAHFTAAHAEEGLRAVQLKDVGSVSYSNFGYQLLGLVIERASGMTYDEVLRTRLTEPLGLTHTGVRGADLPGTRVTGRSGGEEVPHWDQHLPGNGGIESSIDDMASLAKALASPPQSALGTAIRLAQQPRVDRGGGRRQGLGWVIEEDGLVWHNGGSGGFRSEIYVDPTNERAVVLLANDANAGDQLHAAAAKAIRG